MSKLSNKIRDLTRPFCAVVVLTEAEPGLGEAGLLCAVGKMPILARSLRALEDCPAVMEIIVVTDAEKIVETAKLCRDYGILKATKILVGGATWMESALAGLSECSPKADLAAVHDGACALVTEELIERAVHAAALYHAAAPALKRQETVRNTSAEGQAEVLKEATFVQSPEVFVPELIKAALTKAVKTGESIPDCSAAVERMGFAVHFVEGNESNLRLKTDLDAIVAASVIESGILDRQNLLGTGEEQFQLEAPGQSKRQKR